jgi:hypothetical protein
MKEFNFKFTLITINATIDDTNTLTIKQGLRTWKTEIYRLKHLYVLTLPDTGYTLMLTYEDERGKLKKIACNSNFGQPDFEGLVNELVALRPEIDIRTMPVNEAHKLMGAFNMVKLAPVIAFFLVMAVMTVLFLPGIVHGLNTAEQTISIADVGAPGAIKGSILTVTDTYLYIDNYLEVTEKDETTKTVKYYIAMVPDNFKPEDPIHLVMETEEMPESDLQALASGSTFKGILRNVLWEGLSGEYRDYFKNTLKLNLADDVMMLENKTDTQPDMILAFIVLGVAAVIMLVVCVIVAARMPK